eukprot:TRINITY_DN33_c0_g1_i1.p1 TRINITY_DN33_c0_g1~~TRINITY_DN33_c0_g1_i1.p1  ORF type:complete len:504 (+),score=127.27 TRINITY_DN33_c0_g1_i1:58-1569(+)
MGFFGSIFGKINEFFASVPLLSYPNTIENENVNENEKMYPNSFGFSPVNSIIVYWDDFAGPKLIESEGLKKNAIQKRNGIANQFIRKIFEGEISSLKAHLNASQELNEPLINTKHMHGNTMLSDFCIVLSAKVHSVKDEPIIIPNYLKPFIVCDPDNESNSFDNPVGPNWFIHIPMKAISSSLTLLMNDKASRYVISYVFDPFMFEYFDSLENDLKMLLTFACQETCSALETKTSTIFNKWFFGYVKNYLFIEEFLKANKQKFSNRISQPNDFDVESEEILAKLCYHAIEGFDTVILYDDLSANTIESLATMFHTLLSNLYDPKRIQSLRSKELMKVASFNPLFQFQQLLAENENNNVPNVRKSRLGYSFFENDFQILHVNSATSFSLKTFDAVLLRHSVMVDGVDKIYFQPGNSVIDNKLFATVSNILNLVTHESRNLTQTSDLLRELKGHHIQSSNSLNLTTDYLEFKQTYHNVPTFYSNGFAFCNPLLYKQAHDKLFETF